jgi:mannose-6-phosphate isomerase-like protein (cupin superfamily)
MLNEDRVLTVATDARTNLKPAPVALACNDLQGLAALRRQWADMPMTPRVVHDRQEGIDNSWRGFDVRTLLIGEESGGRFTFHDIIIAPDAGLPAYHLENVDTYWCVLEGEVEATVGLRTELARQDSFAFIPPLTTQSIHNRSAAPARLFLWHSPAGCERAFAKAHQRYCRAPDSPAAAYLEDLAALGFVFHRSNEHVANDDRTNEPVARVPAQIETFEDFNKLRRQWTELPATPKLIHDRNLAPDIGMLGQDTKVLVSGDEGSGRCVVFSLTFDSGYRAVRHYQPSEEEIFLVLDGDFQLTAGNITTDLQRGGFGFVPRYGAHGFFIPEQKTNQQARVITINSPAGHERGFEMLVREAQSPRMMELAYAHGWRAHDEAPPAAS